uniref:Biogenesis of lysosome-related organelles complex 1 subunit 2 n=1 Tax=Globisporangium ultimum (strain ATCC 200006 / CBS 805.95 / DAOM BR144) TaxID=431595 RepID=K3XBT3_GLOUD
MENAEVDELRQLTRAVCESVAAYVGVQLSGSLESMEILQQVVLNVNRKYIGMKKEVQSVGKLSKYLKAKADAIDEKLKTIDDIDEELTELEDMVEQLEQYTGSLQAKFYQVS